MRLLASFLLILVTYLFFISSAAEVHAQQRKTAAKKSTTTDEYFGSWRHVSLPKSLRRPFATSSLFSNDNSTTCEHDNEGKDTVSSSSLLVPDDKRKIQQQQKLQLRQEQLHYLQDPDSFELDFEISDVEELIRTSASKRTPLQFKNGPSFLSQASLDACSVRFVTTTSKAKPSALELTCDGLSSVFKSAIDHENEVRKQRQEEEEKQKSASASNNKNNNKRRRAKLSADFDPSVPTFRFLNYDEASVKWPMAKISVVLSSSSKNSKSQKHHERLFEGSSSACIETETSLSFQTTAKEQELPPRNSLSRLASLVPLRQSSETFGTSVSFDQLLNTKNNNNKLLLSIRIQMIPLGSRNPTSRQLVRWMRYVTPSEDLISKILKKNNSDQEVEVDDELDFEHEQKQLQKLKTDKTTMFELRATEKRLTRLGLGLKARIRRNVDTDEETIFKNNKKGLRHFRKHHRNHQPIFTNWSIEVFRRVPRPQVECVAVFSRLLDFPEMFKSSTASKVQHDDDDDEGEETGDDKNKNIKKQKSSKKYNYDDDIFDDEDEEEDLDDIEQGLSKEELKLKRKRDRIRQALTKKEHNAAVPTNDELESAKMHLVASHQLRGLLDSQYALPQFSKMSPTISIPSSPAPNLLDREVDILAARKRPPQGFYVLYVSEERPREQVVDVEIKQADYHFVAPLKLEKKVMNVTFKGEYERLAIPRPPITNWTWFDTRNSPLITPTQVSQHRIMDPRLAAQVATTEAILERQLHDSRGTLPRLMFQYHKHPLFPGFSILIEQNRPIDDLQVWITDGKNDTLFLDEERQVPFTVPSHSHDARDRPLFGWRFALDSQRVIALDTLHISFSFKYRLSDDHHDLRHSMVDYVNENGDSFLNGDDENDDDDDDENSIGNNNDPQNSNNNNKKDQYLSALSHFSSGKEAARHLIAWVDEHRWIPIINKDQVYRKFVFKNSNSSTDDDTFYFPPTDSLNPTQQGLPFFPNFIDLQRNHFTFHQTSILNSYLKSQNNFMMNGALDRSVALEQDTTHHSEQWRLVANRDFEESGEDIFTLPWSAVLRHSQAPSWIIELVTSQEFEQEILKKHEQFLVSNDHVDLLSSSENDENAENENEVQHLKRIRATLKRRRALAFDNAKAWAALTLMHWAQTEPELQSPTSTAASVVDDENTASEGENSEQQHQQQEQHLKWGTETASTRWHSHYRMFNERVKTDAARRLRRYVVSRVRNSQHPKDERAHIPSSSWCPLTESLLKRNAFLSEAANFFLDHHAGLPKTFSGGEISAEDWFTSAYTIIEARSLLVTLNTKSSSSSRAGPRSEWIYVPLLDLATPGVEDANVELSLSRTVRNTNTLALRVSLGKGRKIAKGSPLVFNGWSGGGHRSVAHGLELFGFVTSKMGFAETATPLLPFGPILVQNLNNPNQKQQTATALTRRAVLDECRVRCQRVSEGRTVSMHDDGMELLKKSNDNNNNEDDQEENNDDGMLLTDEEAQEYHKATKKHDSSSSSSSEDAKKCCCNLQWLDAKLRRKWKQITANELLWNMPREILKRQMWAISKVPGELSAKDEKTSYPKNFVALTPEPEPPLWRSSRQYLISSTRKVLETHISEINEEMKRKKIPRIPSLRSDVSKMPDVLSGLNNKELVAVAFADEEKLLSTDAPIESYIDEDLYLRDELRWFSCCKKNGVVLAENDNNDDDVEMKKERQ